MELLLWFRSRKTSLFDRRFVMSRYESRWLPAVITVLLAVGAVSGFARFRGEPRPNDGRHPLAPGRAW